MPFQYYYYYFVFYFLQISLLHFVQFMQLNLTLYTLYSNMPEYVYVKRERE